MGSGALLTGLGPTCQGYFVQGWFKFGGVEVFKTKITKAIGEEAAWNNRNAITLVSSACAEFIADIFLCPYEATRIRLVSNPKFAVQQKAAEAIYGAVGSSPKEMSNAGNITVSLGSGVIAGVAAAIISHPADTLLSKINKAGAGGDGPMFTRLKNIAVETGFVKLCTTGLGARCVMIGTLTAGQFGVFDIVLQITGAKKFHFHDPKH